MKYEDSQKPAGSGKLSWQRYCTASCELGLSAPNTFAAAVHCAIKGKVGSQLTCYFQRQKVLFGVFLQFLSSRNLPITKLPSISSPLVSLLKDQRCVLCANSHCRLINEATNLPIIFSTSPTISYKLTAILSKLLIPYKIIHIKSKLPSSSTIVPHLLLRLYPISNFHNGLCSL